MLTETTFPTDAEVHVIASHFNTGLEGISYKDTFVNKFSDGFSFPNVTPAMAGLLFDEYHALHSELRFVNDIEYWESFITLHIDNYIINN